MNHDQIKQWLDSRGIEGYTIMQDGTVNVSGDVELCFQYDITSIPILFGKVDGNFDWTYSTITSLIGAPHSVGGDFFCDDTFITSLAGAPQSVGGHFSCARTEITSLTGIDKIIKNIDGIFCCDPHVTHLLGLLLIEGVEGVDMDNGPIENIINKYMGTGDILSAQDELIDAGLIDQARL